MIHMGMVSPKEYWKSAMGLFRTMEMKTTTVIFVATISLAKTDTLNPRGYAGRASPTMEGTPMEYPDHYPDGPHEDPMNECDSCGLIVPMPAPIFGDIRCEECEARR